MNKHKNNAKWLSLLLAGALLLTALLAGCGTKDQTPAGDPAGNDPSAADTPDSETPGDDNSGTPETPAESTHVVPIASSFDPEHLEDCVVPISFTNDDIELNDEGKLVLHLTIWEQELFDAAEVSLLQPGDTITVRGQDITVETAENVDGRIHINGGLEAGGLTLAPSESGGTFYESIDEMAEYNTVYTAVQELTLPVNADNFVYTDASDPEKEPETYLAGDLLIMKDEMDFSCTAMNATAHIVDGEVLEISRVYMP